MNFFSLSTNLLVNQIIHTVPSINSSLYTKSYSQISITISNEKFFAVKLLSEMNENPVIIIKPAVKLSIAMTILLTKMMLRHKHKVNENKVAALDHNFKVPLSSHLLRSSKS